MTDANQINGCNHDLRFPADASPPESVQFCGVDEMQAVCETDGWSIEFRQLQAGRLTANTFAGQCADISLLDQGVSRRIEVVGETPEGYITVLAPAGRAEFCVNGRSFDGRGLILFEPDAEMHSVNNEILRVLSMLVPTSLLQETGRDILDTWKAGVRGQAMVIEPSAAIVRRLRLLMRTTIHQPVTGRWAVQRAFDLATGLAAIVDKHAATAKTNCRKLPANAWRTIKHAREFIDAHLTEPISMGKVCAHSGVSLSTLERTFRHELQMSPSQYILARRLVAANRELKKANSSGKQVAHIAMDSGFNHLGRFAGVYHSHFGELPSETLRSM